MHVARADLRSCHPPFVALRTMPRRTYRFAVRPFRSTQKQGTPGESPSGSEEPKNSGEHERFRVFPTPFRSDGRTPHRPGSLPRHHPTTNNPRSADEAPFSDPLCYC